MNFDHVKLVIDYLLSSSEGQCVLHNLLLERGIQIIYPAMTEDVAKPQLDEDREPDSRKHHIIQQFIQTLIINPTPNDLTSSAFLHRCYLRYARDVHHTTSEINVITNKKDFVDYLRNVVGDYEVRKYYRRTDCVNIYRSKGWKLAVPKGQTYSKLSGE